ncbi:MAG: hypothetical protein HY360_04115 [Verrucomicrobia bacterium]|nr:hypothetical protein [Verrucomicrobiota bacterium]
MKLVHLTVFAVAFFGVCMTDLCAAEPAKSGTADLHVPIIINKPAALLTRVWPVTVGVPFKKGEFRDVADLTIMDQTGKAVPCQIVKTGDWTDGSLRWALADFNAELDRQYFLARGARAAAQVPAFAEQFPKAFRVSPKNLTIKLWAEESGRELDFRTPQIIKNYFGHDWIPENHEVAKIANTAQGTAKTHEIWIYPHAGPLNEKVSAQFGATREEIYAAVEPAWLAKSDVMGRIHPRDANRFAEAEEVISDCFDRWVLAGDRVFPATGYLYWGRYPYNSQPHKQKDGRWYPTIHRLSRCLEYNLKRGVWVLYGRSGERKYHDYARKYTRFLGDLQFSNWNSPLKPRGWIVMGDFHSPILWGTFGEDALRLSKKGRKSSMQSEASFLAVASSEDVIQFVYDYFLTGDYHSCDMARMYIEALVKETDFEVDKALAAGGGRPEAMLRMIGAAYDLDHDPRLLEFGSKLIKRMARPDGELNEEVPSQYGKWGEKYGAFYYYYVATGDPLVRKTLVKLAESKYRRGDVTDFFDRSSPLLQAVALAYEDTGNPVYAAYLAQTIRNFGKNWPTLKKMGVDVAQLNQKTTASWGQETMTGEGPVNIGIPTAEAAVASLKGSFLSLPVAVKPSPTQRTTLLLKKEKPESATLEVYVNNWGDFKVAPKLTDSQGKAVPIEVVERDYHRVTPMDPFRDTTYSKWFNKYEDHIYYRLCLPQSLPPGTYQLDLGSEVAFTVLSSEMDQVVQLAPQGVVILKTSDVISARPPGNACPPQTRLAERRRKPSSSSPCNP